MVDHTIYESEYIPIIGNNYQTIEHSKDDHVIITVLGLRKNGQKSIIYHFFAIIFLGIPYLLVNWYPKLLKYIYTSVKLDQATFVLVRDNLQQTSIIPVHEVDYYLNDNHQHIRFFEYQHCKYIWKDGAHEFQKLDPVDKKYKLEDLVNNLPKGLTEDQQNELIKLHGLNKIHIEIKSYWTLFITEVFHPFYMFQTFSIILWSYDEYYQYATCILFLSIVSVVTSLYQTKKQSIALHNLVESSYSRNLDVYRPSFGVTNDENVETWQFKTIEVNRLVPGDVIAIPKHGCIMPCDAVLLTGLCIVNEAMLTGESTPVTKTPPNPSNEWYEPNAHKRHTLFSGTQVIQTRYHGDSKVLALVVRTGFETCKGELVKSILYPKPMGFKFYQDSLRFIGFLFIVAAIGMTYCVYLYLNRGAELMKILLRTLDIITIVVPPALPAAMTAGTVYSQSRLKALGIYCINPARINMSGKLKLVCFDKTGTLTHEGLNFYAVIPAVDGKFTQVSRDPWLINDRRPIKQAMATCHSLTRLQGNISGDPLDLNMFEATNWILEEPGSENTRYKMLAPTVVYPPGEAEAGDILDEDNLQLPYQIGIIRQFTFSSSQQSMSVICKILGTEHFTLYVKGAPEKIIDNCDASTVPPEFNELLKEYAIRGFRMIALAYKDLDVKLRWKDAQKIKREEIEHNLTFLGLLVMQNTLKPESAPVIRDLYEANIRTIMITGDNIMTAISVGRECGMIRRNERIVLIKHDLTKNALDQPIIQFELVDSTNHISTESPINSVNFLTHLNLKDSIYHFAMDGATWNTIRHYYPSWISSIVLKGTIFARFGPDQKTQLVTHLQELDYIVGMVGDGANDCGALKAAHIGISLSEAEASVAAPFTSSIQNISCVKHIVLEGRCALVTSFAIFKYMALYSFIQFISVLILYTRYSTLGNMQFLFIDLVITTSLAVSMGRQGPSDKIVPKRPIGSLVSLRNTIPLILQVVVCGMIQIGALYHLLNQSWYSPIAIFEELRTEEIKSWDNTVIFTVSCFQYIILAFVYSKGKPYRVTILSNGLILFTFLSLTCFCGLILIDPIQPTADFFELIPRENIEKDYDKNMFRDTLLVFPIIHFILSIFIEYCIAESTWFKLLVHFIIRKKQPKNKYKLLNSKYNESGFILPLSSDYDPTGIYC